MALHRITPFLWFDSQAEEAAKFYVSVFRDSKLGKVSRYGEAGKAQHGRAAGSVMTVEFEIEGQKFIALNGGPVFKFNESVSFVVNCEDQAEIDYYWERLLEGGGRVQECGWLKDRFGLSWQVVPARLAELMGDARKAEKVMEEIFRMKKIDLPTLERAAESVRP